MLEYFQKLSRALNKIHLQRQETAGDNLRQNHQKQVIIDFLFHLSCSLPCPSTSSECCKADGTHLLLWEMQWCTAPVSSQQWGKTLIIGNIGMRGWNWEQHCIWIKCDLWSSLLKKKIKNELTKSPFANCFILMKISWKSYNVKIMESKMFSIQEQK